LHFCGGFVEQGNPGRVGDPALPPCHAVPNVQSVLACFSKNRSKISGRCNAVLASYGF
jgi:hypothetical protein